MVIWGAVWGAIIGLMQFRGGDGFGLFVGAALGALAGWTLRRSIRKEVAQQMAQHASPVPDLPELTLRPPFADTHPQQEDKADDGPAAATTPSRPAAGTEAPPVPTMAKQTQVSAQPRPATTAQTPATSYASLATKRAGKTVDVLDEARRLTDTVRNWLLGGNTIVRLGLLVLFVGLAFLAKYAAENSLLPPELRLAGIGIVGIALFVVGLRLSRRQDHRKAYALALQGGGVAVLYLTVFAAFRLYQFLPASAAFGALALVCAFSTAVALMQNAMPMAFIDNKDTTPEPTA